MSAQSIWWETVTKNLAEKKAVNPTIDTCPTCWATSGLPAVVFKGEPGGFCGTCSTVMAKIKVAKN